MPADSRAAGRTASRGPDDGTPEQIHLTWGDDPARSVVVSWASPGRAARPRVRIGQRVIPAEERGYTDGLNGQTVLTYHAQVHGLRPGATYGYAVTADNDSNAADPFSAMFSTAPEGRAAFRFTSFGDLATPNTDWVLSYGQAAYAVRGGAVPAAVPPAERRPLLREPEPGGAAAGVARLRQQQPGLGGEPAVDAGAWQPRDRVRQRPAGLHFVSDPLRAAGTTGPGVRGAVVLVPGRLGAVRLAERRRRGVPGRAARSWPAPRRWCPRPVHRQCAIARGHLVLHPRLLRRRADAVAGGDPGARPGRDASSTGSSRRCTRTPLVLARRQRLRPGHPRRHGCRCSTATRSTWCSAVTTTTTSGRSPFAGSTPPAGTSVATGAPVDTRQPHPVTTEDSGVFDTSQGTVHLILGCGGTNATLDVYGVDAADGAACRRSCSPRPTARSLPDDRPAFTCRPARRRGGGRDLVGTPRHRDRLRHRGVRREPWHGAAARRRSPSRTTTRSAPTR